MNTPFIPALLGLILILLGLSNVKGNLSSIHWYHRQRVTEENKAIFGRLVGGGTILIGSALVLFSLCSFAAERMQNMVLLTCGSVLLITAVVIGLGVSFYAMIKYNKGIF